MIPYVMQSWLCDTLRRDAKVDLDPERLSRLLKSFSESFGGGPGQRAFFAIAPDGADNVCQLILPVENQEDYEP